MMLNWDDPQTVAIDYRESHYCAPRFIPQLTFSSSSDCCESHSFLQWYLRVSTRFTAPLRSQPPDLLRLSWEFLSTLYYEWDVYMGKRQAKMPVLVLILLTYTFHVVTHHNQGLHYLPLVNAWKCPLRSCRLQPNE